MTPSAVRATTHTYIKERPLSAGSAEKGPVTVDDAAWVQARLASGAIGTLESSGVATGHKNQHTWEINGSQGSLAWDLEDPNHLWVYSEAALPAEVRGFAGVSVTTGAHPLQTVYLPPGHNAGWEYGHVHALHHFLDCVANDKPVAPLAATFEDGYRVQVIMDAIARSSRTGRRISLSY